MLFHRKSILTGIEHTMDIPVTNEEMIRWGDGAMVQDAFPNLTPNQREFILSGITPEEWDATFPKEDDDEVSDSSNA